MQGCGGVWYTKILQNRRCLVGSVRILAQPGGHKCASMERDCAKVQLVHSSVGERIYDAASGSAGFLCKSFDYLKATKNLTASDRCFY